MSRRQVARKCGIYDRARPSCFMEGVLAESAGTVLGADELEALRLSDLIGLDQTEAALRMNISQSTFQRILTVARRKAAASLVSGQSLTVAKAWDADMNTTSVHGQREEKTGGTKMVMRIALPTDDGTTLCQHFGRAHYYKVVEMTDGKVTATEMRDKFAHVCGDAALDSGLPHEEVHKHLADAAHGCDTVIAGGMGKGAMDALIAAGLKVVQTEMVVLDDIVAAFAAGTLTNAVGQMHCCQHEGEKHGTC